MVLCSLWSQRDPVEGTTTVFWGLLATISKGQKDPRRSCISSWVFLPRNSTFIFYSSHFLARNTHRAAWCLPEWITSSMNEQSGMPFPAALGGFAKFLENLRLRISLPRIIIFTFEIQRKTYGGFQQVYHLSCFYSGSLKKSFWDQDDSQTVLSSNGSALTFNLTTSDLASDKQPWSLKQRSLGISYYSASFQAQFLKLTQKNWYIFPTE